MMEGGFKDFIEMPWSMMLQITHKALRHHVKQLKIKSYAMYLLFFHSDFQKVTDK